METFLNNLDKDKVELLLQETEDNVQYFNNTCQKIVDKYCDSLDKLMKDIYLECISPGIEDTSFQAPLDRLQAYYLEISCGIYFIIHKLENLGVYADMSDSASKEVYSKKYIELSRDKDTSGKAKSTVEELKSKSSVEAQYNSVVASIYDRAYKIVKGKVESAKEMMNTLRRLISTRTSEMQLYSVNQGE